jgi:hypothetical protein
MLSDTYEGALDYQSTAVQPNVKYCPVSWGFLHAFRLGNPNISSEKLAQLAGRFL